jgi:hypothetical protein
MRMILMTLVLVSMWSASMAYQTASLIWGWLTVAVSLVAMVWTFRNVWLMLKGGHYV